MRNGAFAMFDALGFKGIWDRASKASPPWDVLGKLESLVVQADDIGGFLPQATSALVAEGKLANVEHRTLFLSDTIVVGCWAEDPTGKDQEGAQWAALLGAARIAANIMARAADAPQPRFAYRGCIAIGDFEIRPPSFVLGRAVDEAAELADSAEAAFVWLAPSAKRVVDTVQRRDELTLLRPWAVPLKGGHRYSTYLVSPYEGVLAPSRRDLRTAIAATFASGRFEVQLKLQNTTEFLDGELARLNQKSAEAASSHAAAGAPVR